MDKWGTGSSDWDGPYWRKRDGWSWFEDGEKKEKRSLD